MKTYVILLARRSTDQKQIESLDSQVKYCLNHFPQYPPDKIFRITETGANKERDRFRNEYLKLVEQKTKEGFKVVSIAYAGNRYTRNFEDYDSMIRLFRMGAVFFAGDSKLEHTQDIIPFACHVGVSSVDYFSTRDASARGRQDAMEKGKYIVGRTPVGFQDTKQPGIKEIDPTTAPGVVEIFDLYATGKYSLISLRPIAEEIGERYGFNVNTPEKLRRMLRNKFYDQVIVDRKNDCEYKSLSPRLVPHDIFMRCQQILSGRTPKTEKKHNFIFSGRIRMPSGQLLIGDIKKGKYVYYRDRFNGFRALREVDLIDALGKYLRYHAQHIDKYKVKYAISQHLSSTVDEKEKFRKSLTMKMMNVEQKLKSLAQMRLDGELESDEYLSMKKDFLDEKSRLNEQSASFENESTKNMDLLLRGADRFVELLDLLGEAIEFLGKGRNEIPREKISEIVDITVSNFSYDGENVDIKPSILLHSVLIADKSSLAVPSETWDELLLSGSEIEELVNKLGRVEEFLAKPIKKASFSAKKLLASLAMVGYLALATVPTAMARPTNKGLLECTNEIREENGLGPLIRNRQLDRAATLKARDMKKYRYWAHFNPVNHTSPWYFIELAGYKFLHAGENLALAIEESDEVCRRWAESRFHLENILNPNFTHVGFAVTRARLDGQRGSLVVQLFGSR